MATPVREVLLASNGEFRRLVQEHHDYSRRLDALVSKPYLSEEEKIEEIKLKKLKLHLKDQIEMIEQHFRHSNPEHAA